MFENYLIIFAVFTATTVAGLLYALLYHGERVKGSKITYVNHQELPKPMDTHLSPMVLEADRKVSSFEQMVEDILRGVDDGREEDGG